ncbi:MAG: hypothetical protein KZQ93_20995 [Candidatus Thiodiazotropha sp. (ex Monitilora ramsayi)]|nr:hypothetical protein [Candidatus Thiodiazotropha sp. (ex Monitilora ramsayi)]
MEASGKNNSALWVLLGALLIAVSAVALYKAWPVLFPKVAMKASLDPACDLRAGPCITEVDGGGRVSFAIEPREIPMVKPLQLQVSLQGLQANSIEVDFAGVDMHMGFNRFKLTRDASGEFSGKGMLPVCVRDAMEWEAQVLIDSGQGLISVPYRFITVRPGVPLPGSDS